MGYTGVDARVSLLDQAYELHAFRHEEKAVFAHCSLGQSNTAG